MSCRQPPSGGCVLKHKLLRPLLLCLYQPPSGGCVLKRIIKPIRPYLRNPAAFGRLCVETKTHATFVIVVI